MDLSVFCQSFNFVFLILIAVGPGFLTIANIAITRGYKTSAVAVCGCFLGDCILISLGVFFAQKAITIIPKEILICLSFVAVFLLYYLSFKFITTDVYSLKTKILDKKNGIALSISLFCLKMSSPICIIGYSIVFTQLIKTSNAYMSACFGGYSASIVANIIMVSVFGTIGRKINVKALSILNKISAIFIGCFATFLFFQALKEFFLFLK